MKGSKVHAFCVKKWFLKFQCYLKEDRSIYVKKPSVATNTSKFNLYFVAFVDIIGHIFEYGSIDSSEQDKSKHKMLLHFQDIDISTNLKVTLWVNFFLYVGLFLSGYFGVGRLFINNDIDEITSYKNKLVSQNGQQLSSSVINMIASKQDI
uniref:Uncharacterized protein n=1 Tax=Lactuca sativa TaxID=4236 RepID=A0A9R1VJL0_LACSA|nr:hypothetical protein LSAT_V11C500251960 [Lactuca sativa]